MPSTHPITSGWLANRKRSGYGKLRTHTSAVRARPGPEPLKRLVQRIAERIGRSLERSGLITRDIENAYLAFDLSEEPPIHGLLSSSITGIVTLSNEIIEMCVIPS